MNCYKPITKCKTMGEMNELKKFVQNKMDQSGPAWGKRWCIWNDRMKEIDEKWDSQAIHIFKVQTEKIKKAEEEERQLSIKTADRERKDCQNRWDQYLKYYAPEIPKWWMLYDLKTGKYYTEVVKKIFDFQFTPEGIKIMNDGFPVGCAYTESGRFVDYKLQSRDSMTSGKQAEKLFIKCYLNAIFGENNVIFEPFGPDTFPDVCIIYKGKPHYLEVKSSYDREELQAGYYKNAVYMMNQGHEFYPLCPTIICDKIDTDGYKFVRLTHIKVYPSVMPIGYGLTRNLMKCTEKSSSDYQMDEKYLYRRHEMYGNKEVLSYEDCLDLVQRVKLPCLKLDPDKNVPDIS